MTTAEPDTTSDPGDGAEPGPGDGTAPGAPPAPGATPASAGEPAADPGDAPAIRTRGLTKRYGDLYAVRGLDLDVPRGSVFGLIGPNGAGKTTTFSILATLLKPTAGSARVLGYDPAQQPREVRRRLGYMPDVLGVYDGLRVDEYLEFFAAAYQVPKARWSATVETLLELVDLTTKRDALVNSLSRGMKQRLSLARALVHDPEVLVLDEPASGLDPRARIELRNLLRELRDMGKTIVISSHILAELTEMCTEIGIMEKGTLLASGTPGSIRGSLRQGRQIRVRLAADADAGGDRDGDAGDGGGGRRGEGGGPGEGEVRTYTVADDAEQTALLRSLLDEGLPVLEFTEVGHGLEDLFMQITTGEVQ